MTDPARFATPRRLHPASIIVGLPPRQLLQILVLPLIVTFAGASPSLQSGLQVFGLYAGIGLVVRTVGYQRRLFSFDGQMVRIQSGVLARQQRTIAVERIQQIELRRSAISRALGLATVRIETAASASEPEVELRVIAYDDAVALRAAVRAAANTQGEQSTPNEPVLTVPARHLVLAALTGNRLLTLPGVVFAGFQFVGAQLGSFVEDVVDWLSNPPDTLSQFDTVLSAVAFPLVVAGAVAASVIFALLVTFLRDGRFTITRNGDELHVSRGIIATRDSLISVQRIQLVELKQNWLRRLFGVATVRLQSAGGDAEARVLIPLLRVTDAHQFTDTVLTDTTAVPLTAHPPAARYRSVLRWLRFSLPTVAVLVFSADVAEHIRFIAPLNEYPQLRASALGIVVGVAVLLGLASYRLRGHAISDTLVIAQTGALNRRLLIAPIQKIQTIGLRANLFQRRLSLATLLVRVAGARTTVVIHDGDANALDQHARALTAAAARPRTAKPR